MTENNKKLEFDLNETELFLGMLDPKGIFTFQTFSDKKGLDLPAKIFHGTLEEHAESLMLLNKVGCGVFVTVNETNSKGRKASDVVNVRAHFIDSDDEPIEEVCQRIPLAPHIVIESSNGRGHAYFKVYDTKLSEFTETQALLNESLGTDPAVKDLSRTMRLPGFFHMKGEPRLVRILKINETLPPYSRTEIVGALTTAATEGIFEVEPLRERKKADPLAPLGDGFRTEALTSLIGQLLAKGLDEEETLHWMMIWNKCNEEPLPEEKIVSTIRSMIKTDQRNHSERYGKELENTDAGNAKRFVSMFGDDIRYCHDRGVWLFWDGQRWILDNDGEILRKATQTATAIYNETASAVSLEEKGQKAKWAKSSLSAPALKNMIMLAQNERVISTVASRLDRNDMLINLVNGTYDLELSEFRPHRRQDMMTKMVQVAYEQSASCPNWLAFLDCIFEGNQELVNWLQKVVGYGLTGSTVEQCAFFFIGDGSNGKSTFLNALKAIWGDYAVQTQPETFLVRRFNDAGSPRSDLMRLAGARLAIASEGEEGQRLAESFIKQITGGEEISTRAMYGKNQVEFLPRLKMFYCSNHKPSIRGTDHGIWRRIRVIPFSVCIPEAEMDPHLLKRLCQEGSGILNWALKGCQRWQEERLLDIPVVVQKASTVYREENDVVGRFLENCCKQEGKIQNSQLYQVYSDWCQKYGEDRKNQVEFSNYLSSKRYEKYRDNKGVVWKGLTVISFEDERAEAA